MEVMIDIDCPKCSRKFKAELRKLKPGNTLTCPHCAVTIKLEGDDASALADLGGDLGGKVTGYTGGGKNR